VPTAKCQSLINASDMTLVADEAALVRIGMDEPEFKIVDVFVCHLRKKLAQATEASTLSIPFGVEDIGCAIGAKYCGCFIFDGRSDRRIALS
jgi:hypothetical protein